MIGVRFRVLENQQRVFLNEQEYDNVVESTPDRDGELMIRLMYRSLLRRCEIIRIRPKDFQESSHPDADLIKLHICSKDTTGSDNDGKLRETWVPMSLYEDLKQYWERENTSPDSPIFPCSKGTINNRVDAAAEQTAAQTGNEDYKHLSPHDFRASGTTHLLHARNVDPRVVMDIGGWEDSRSLEPYEMVTFDVEVQNELYQAGLLEGADYDAIRSEEDLYRAVEELCSALQRQGIDVDIERDTETQTGIERFTNTESVA